MMPGALMLDLTSTELTAEEKELVQHPHVGGVIFFSRNLVEAKQAAHLVGELRALRPELLLAVDQEGGRVQRLKQGFTQLPPLRQLGYLYERNPEAGLQAARLLGQLMADEVLAVGMDLSFAPVLDLDLGLSQVIGDRAFASCPQAVINLAEAYIQGMQRSGMAAVGKHFPGHGQVTADSHTHLPIDERSLEAIEASCLQPFAALAPLLQGIMPAHVIYSAVDPKPAGFSSFWLGYLRQQLGFNGMIFSDDLSMTAAEVAGSFSERAEAALNAGCDQVLVCNNRAAALEVLDWLEQQHYPAGEHCSALAARLPYTQSWSSSPEALLARKLANCLNQQDLQAAETLLC